MGTEIVAEEKDGQSREISYFRGKKQNSTWLLAAAPIERFLGPKEMQALEKKTFKHQTLLQHYIQQDYIATASNFSDSELKSHIL